MEVFRGWVLVKIGVEGVFCVLIFEFGFGVVLKCDDGVMCVVEVMMVIVLEVMLDLNEDEVKFLDILVNLLVLICWGVEVG